MGPQDKNKVTWYNCREYVYEVIHTHKTVRSYAVLGTTHFIRI